MIKYREIAIAILKEAKEPITPNEIWERAVEKNLIRLEDIQGKTPKATLASLLFRESNKGTFHGEKTPFKFTTSPRKYWLEDK